MPIVDLTDLPKRGPLLAIDPGSKTLGIAACDTLRLIASPVETIKRGKKLRPALERIFEIFDDRQAVGIIVGLPLNMDGTIGPSAQAARALSRNILGYREVIVAMQDERLTSQQAERVMIQADLSRARRAESIDASAAAIILQTAIDRLANTTEAD